MPTAREGVLHAARQKVISNKALRLGAIEAGIPPYIQSKPIVPKVWQPQMHYTDEKEPMDANGEAKDADTKEKDLPTQSQGSASGVSPEQAKAPRPSGGKRKRQRNEYLIQWLGDKVCLYSGGCHEPSSHAIHRQSQM